LAIIALADISLQKTAKTASAAEGDLFARSGSLATLPGPTRYSYL
jgi:hypothetical protein